jgi:hypothetical protein
LLINLIPSSVLACADEVIEWDGASSSRGTAAWPMAARAQQGDRVRRIAVLMNLAADDPESQRRMIGFVQTL